MTGTTIATEVKTECLHTRQTHANVAEETIRMATPSPVALEQTTMDTTTAHAVAKTMTMIAATNQTVIAVVAEIVGATTTNMMTAAANKRARHADATTITTTTKNRFISRLIPLSRHQTTPFRPIVFLVHGQMDTTALRAGTTHR